MKTLSLLCTVLIFVSSNVYSEEKIQTVNPDEEIKKYEIRGIMDTEEPSVSIYYEGKQLGWMKSGQKKGNCLFKAYDKETKEAVLEINGKQYRLKEGAQSISDSEGEELKKEIVKIGDKHVLKVSSKDPNRIFNIIDLREMIREYEEIEEIHLYGATLVSMAMGDPKQIDMSNVFDLKKAYFTGGKGTFIYIPKDDSDPSTRIRVKAGE